MEKREQLENVRGVDAVLDRERALADGGQTLVNGERLGELMGDAEPVRASLSQERRVDDAISTLLDPRPDVASDRNDLEVGPKEFDLQSAAKRRGPDRAARFDRRQGAPIKGHHRVPRVLPRRDTAEREPRMQKGR